MDLFNVFLLFKQLKSAKLFLIKHKKSAFNRDGL